MPSPSAGSPTDQQRRHLAEQTGSWDGDFERLACAPDQPARQVRTTAMGSGCDYFPSS